MNTISSLLKFLGDTLGAKPSTLKTTSKTLVGAINEIKHDVRRILYTTVDSELTSAPTNTRVSVTATYNVPEGYTVFVVGANVRATGTNYGQICLSGLQSSVENGVCTLSCYARNTYSSAGSISIRFRLLLFTPLD